MRALRALSVGAVALIVSIAPVRTSSEQGVPALPERLSIEEFWRLSVELSEPDATFISDNLVSNEMSFAQVVPQLRASIQPGGVYIGVGPEQNFTYLAALQARFGFIVDIRRDNLLLHLMYKALFDLAPNRAAFLSRLFSRTAPALPDHATVADLMTAMNGAPADDDAAYRQEVEDVRKVLVERYHLPLTAKDLAGIDEMYGAFRRFGPSIGYATTQRGQAFGEVSYANLMKQSGAQGEPLSFLGSEVNYQFVKELQARNAIIPVVGNFAGPKAIRAIGSYLRTRNATVAAFYLSNVEDYLGLERVPENGDWHLFCANAATLPRDSHSVFVRPLGLAVYGSDGSVRLSRRMQISGRGDDTVTLSVPDAKLPPALSPIGEEVRICGGT